MGLGLTYPRNTWQCFFCESHFVTNLAKAISYLQAAFIRLQLLLKPVIGW